MQSKPYLSAPSLAKSSMLRVNEGQSFTSRAAGNLVKGKEGCDNTQAEPSHMLHLATMYDAHLTRYQLKYSDSHKPEPHLSIVHRQMVCWG